VLEPNPPLALTFDDVLLVPGASGVLPREVDVRANLSPTLSLRVPLLSSAMDTVTGADLAIAIARLGGLGVVHKNMHLNAQAAEIRAVKRAVSGTVADPVTVAPTATVAAARALMREYDVSGLPVVEDGRVVGILTHRDLRFETRLGRSVRDVMTTELVTAPPGTPPDVAKALLAEHRIEKLLIVDADRRLRGLVTIRDIEDLDRHPDAVRDARGQLRVGAAVGVGGDREERVAALVEAGVDVIVVDTAHGHSQGVLAAAAAVKAAYPDVVLVVGNVATGDATRACLDAGADVVKVGVGPGSICTTRVVAGVGVPQLTAVADAAAVAHAAGKTIIADGGLKSSGDVAKAIAAGADAVMIGSLFAGTDEAPGDTVLYQGRRYKSYRGMGSIDAMKAGSSDRYFQDDAGDPEHETKKLVPEGVVGRVPYKGPLADVVHQLVGGLRASCGYVGAASLDEMRTKSRFVRITPAGLRESHVHDVEITQESPNYRLG
jgi:IMP dehydrogenase